VKLLDTTVAIDHLRGHPAAAQLLERILDEDEPVGASELVRFELIAGVRDDEWASLERFFAGLIWVPVTEDVSRTAGAMARRYGAAYSGIDDVDYVISATALVLEAELLTTNVRHFPMIEGLTPAY
jgi:predicted nucleic acid-binding protein